MSGISFIQLAVVAVAAIAAFGSPAEAQIFHTWVSSNGSDASATCDRPAPCATFSGALGKTAAGGEITCVDSGNFGAIPLAINKSITINCEGAIGSGSPPGATSIGLIDVMTGATDTVILRGLDLDGFNAVGGSGTGGLINFSGAGTLRLEKMKVSNFGSSFEGVQFIPSGTARLHVVDSYIVNNNRTGIGAGIMIRPASGVTATVTVERSVIDNNHFGIIADGTAGGIIRGLVSESSVSGNVNNGITVSSTGASVVLGVHNVRVAGNSFGLVASGSNAGMLVRHSFITANGTGLFTASSGVILSYRDNSLNANTTDGAFTGPVGLQ